MGNTNEPQKKTRIILFIFDLLLDGALAAAVIELSTQSLNT
jgi:hypothetical protein